MRETMSHAAAMAPDGGAHSFAGANVGHFSPPLVAPSHVQVLNAFFRRRRPLVTTVAGREAVIMADWPPADRDRTEWWSVALRVDAEEGELALPRSWLDLLIAEVDADLSLDRLHPDAAALVVEFALSDTLEAIERGLGTRLAVRSVDAVSDPAQEEWPALSFALTIAGLGTAICKLRLPPRHALKVAQQLDQRAGVEQLAVDLPVAACLRVGAAALALAEARSLSPGDVVLLDEHCEPEGAAVAVFGEHLVAPVELKQAGGRLASAPMRGQGTRWEWSMDDSAQHDPRNSAPPAASLDDLPVRLVLEVGRLELQLSELRALAPGAVLPLARPLDDVVDIVANGRRIGRGTIVRIGDSVGVRVTRLLDNV